MARAPRNNSKLRLRVPERAGAVDVNFCRNPLCVQFGVEPYRFETRGHRSLPPRTRDHSVVGSRDSQSLRCNHCRTEHAIKSNLAIAEEFERLRRRFLRTNQAHCCPNTRCFSYGLRVDEHGELYVKHGKTAKGEQRYRCKACGKTFTCGVPARRHRRSHVNGRVMELLVSRVPLARIARRTGISAPTLYDKIDFLYERCRSFLAERDARIALLPKRRWQLSTDRQDILVNWPRRALRATIQVGVLVTADRRSGYALAVHPQIDPDIDPEEQERLVVESNDLAEKRHFRRYGRVWTQAEYERYLAPAVAARQRRARRFQQAIAAANLPAPDPDEFDGGREADEPSDERQLPNRGAMVHIDVLQYAHALYVRHLLEPAIKTVLHSVDEDAGLIGAVCSAWKEHIVTGDTQVASVRFWKEATIDDKDAEALVVARKLEPHIAAHPDLARWEIEEMLFAEDVRTAIMSAPDWEQRLSRSWTRYPYPTKAETQKEVRLVTGGRTLDEHGVARAIRQASLHPADRVMMLFRAMLTGFERGVVSPRRDRRIYSRYAFYNSLMLEKVTTIFRMHYNYMEPGADGQTPAMRLGLAKGKIYMRDLLRN
jgi:transposase-like protein